MKEGIMNIVEFPIAMTAMNFFLNVIMEHC